ncbi:hypothetical protein GCM10009576_040810 [Streptomyces rhizosphaericus]|uniref:Uncharacterized protein n=1 Tax=Streptomyces rhizosphaericus TaxID=114699 RepID=A0ABN1SAW9_9ACTN
MTCTDEVFGKRKATIVPTTLTNAETGAPPLSPSPAMTFPSSGSSRFPAWIQITATSATMTGYTAGAAQLR